MNALAATSCRSRILRRPVALALATFAALLALPSSAWADRDHDRDRGRDRDWDRSHRYDRGGGHDRRQRSQTHFSVGIGLSSGGFDRWSLGVGRSYHRPYYGPRFYPGYYVRHLPNYHRRVVYDSNVYFVADDVYYRPYDSGYVVVERPVIVERPASTVRYEVTDDGVNPNQEIGAPKPLPEYISVWQGEQELRLIDGEFFKPTANGLVWVSTPVGAVSDVLPIGAQVVWHEDVEYFRFDGAVFRKTPDGYKVVAAPWGDAAPADSQ